MDPAKKSTMTHYESSQSKQHEQKHSNQQHSTILWIKATQKAEKRGKEMELRGLKIAGILKI